MTSTSKPSNQKCSVCGARSHQFNYGVVTCNSCQAFFRRAVINPNPVPPCQNQKNCVLLGHISNYKRCRYCRLQKCLSAGMSLISGAPKHGELSRLLNLLIILDKEQTHFLSNCLAQSMDPTVVELIPNDIQFKKRPANFLMQFNDWVVLQSSSCINFLKNLNVTSKLVLTDQTILIKEFLVKAGLLQSAWTSFSNKKKSLQFLDGTDCFPENSSNGLELENRIRFRLVGRFTELHITHEEYLLLVLIFYSNPGHTGLTDTGKTIIGIHQKKYNFLLFQHCKFVYQKSAPTRFMNLLSLCHVVNQTFEDIKLHYLCTMMNRPSTKYPRIVTEVL